MGPHFEFQIDLGSLIILQNYFNQIFQLGFDLHYFQYFYHNTCKADCIHHC